MKVRGLQENSSKGVPKGWEALKAVGLLGIFCKCRIGKKEKEKKGQLVRHIYSLHTFHLYIRWLSPDFFEV